MQPALELTLHPATHRKGWSYTGITSCWPQETLYQKEAGDPLLQVINAYIGEYLHAAQGYEKIRPILAVLASQLGGASSPPTRLLTHTTCGWTSSAVAQLVVTSVTQSDRSDSMSGA